MDNNSFWLFNLDDTVLSVSLVQSHNNLFNVSSVGPVITHQSDRESSVAAVDQSLSEAASQIHLSDDQEPNTAALILPPFWVGSDGKIVADKRKIIEHICRDLELKPMGFISNDDAIVEDANHTEGFPASFVLVNISPDRLIVSLAYMGKIIERVTRPLSDTFDPSILETCLTEFKSESTLPPQMILFGTLDDQVVDSIKNYSWLGKKSVETFLHLPDIKTYSLPELDAIYTRAITLQFKPQSAESMSVQADPEIPADNNFPEDDNLSQSPIPESVVEVDANELGFGLNTVPETNVEISPDLPVPELELTATVPDPVVVKPARSLPRVTFPKFSLPNLSFSRFYLLLLPLVFSPLFVLIPFFLSRADITLYVTAYNYNKQVNAILDPAANKISQENKIIPVNTKTFTINSSATVSTTGTKTTGEKARGEVVVYNKQDKEQNLAKGSILVDDKGNKFELTVAAVVASSSSNLDAGVITLGQTKVTIAASDIGPEYNLAKDAKLRFKDISESALVAKVKDQISGGTKRQIKAVSAADKISVDSKLKANINSKVGSSANEEIAQISGLIKDSVQTKTSRTEYNREIGEEADELTANSENNITVFYLDSDKKVQLLNAYLSADDGYGNSTINPEDFNISIANAKTSGDNLSGLLTIEGKATPKIDIITLSKKLSGQSLSRAENIIRGTPRVYNFQIDRNMSYLNFINPLPYRLQNITIKVK